MRLPFSNFFKESISRLIMASFIFVLLVPMSFLIYSLFENSWDKARLGMLEKHSLIARSLVQPLSLHISAKQHTLKTVADDIYKYGHEYTYANKRNRDYDIQKILNKYQESFEDVLAISYVSSVVSGYSHISTKSSNSTKEKPPNYSMVEMTMLPSIGEGGGMDLLSPMFRSSITNTPVMLMKHYVTDKNNKVFGAVFTELSLSYVKTICGNINFGVKGHCAIVDQKGRVIAHPNKAWEKEIRDLSKISIIQKMLARESGTTEFYSPFLKGDMVAGYASIDYLGWSVMIPQPKKELMGVLDDLMKNMLIWLFVGVIVALFVAFLLTRKISRPLSILMKRTQEVDAGYDHIKLGSIPKNSPKEISQLWLSITTLLTSLQKSNGEVKRLNVSLHRDIDKATVKLTAMNKRLYNISSRDHLTTLVNRRYFSNYVKKSLQKPSTKMAAVIGIDVDKFKFINDTYGHEAGDHALVHVAKILQRSTRKHDLVARLGGDEFVIYIENASDKIIARIAENLRYLAENTPAYWEGQKMALSLSIGTVNLQIVEGHRVTLEDLLSFADKAMYQSKKHGRNYVSAYEIKKQRVTDRVTIEDIQKLNDELREELEKSSRVENSKEGRSASKPTVKTKPNIKPLTVKVA